MKRPPSRLPQSPAEQAEALLAQAQSGRAVIQDFVPLAESLEWDLGQQYLRLRGNKAFLSDFSPVPYVINNDGNLSRQAAAVFFASLQAAEVAGTLGTEDIGVLELGIGVGLFARFFLDSFRDLCWQQGKDYYDRLTYIAADRSQRMLSDVARHGVLSRHPGRYKLRQVDALQPAEQLPSDPMFAGKKGPLLRAVFLNYLLDCLPAAVLDLSEPQEVQQLQVRTCLARNIRLEAHTSFTLGQLQERAKSSDPRHREELLEVYGLFASEYAYRPVAEQDIPLGEFALEHGRRLTKKLLHSYGAIQCLERLLPLVAEDGFILLSDYGPTTQERDYDFEHQRFSLATFVGINFPELATYFRERLGHSWLQPPGGDAGGIHSRLLSQRPATETRMAFDRAFSLAAQEERQEKLQLARQLVRAGRFELAADQYRQALKQQPNNWVLLSEAASFLIFQLRDIKTGVGLARVALSLNPTCSAELWNTLGDGLFEWGRTAEAKSAYLKALQVNEADVRARYNLACCHQRDSEFGTGLQRLAEALELDRTGEYRERLLKKQEELLIGLTRKHQQEYLLLINLVSRSGKVEEENSPPRPQRALIEDESNALSEDRLK